MPKSKSPFNFKQIPALYNSVSFKEGSSEHDARGFPDLLSILRKEKGGFKAVASDLLLIEKPIVWQIHILSLSTIMSEMDYYISLACWACDDGFTLLLPINDELEECTSSEEFLAKFKQIIPMHENKLLDKLTKKNLGRGDVTILNYPQGKWLINEIAKRSPLFPKADQRHKDTINRLEVSLENLLPLVKSSSIQQQQLLASYPRELNLEEGITISLKSPSQLLAQDNAAKEPANYFPTQLSIDLFANKGDYSLFGSFPQTIELTTVIETAADINYLKSRSASLSQLESLGLTLSREGENDETLIDLMKLSSFAGRLRSVKLTDFSEENNIFEFLNSLTKLEELEISDASFIEKKPSCLPKLRRLHITDATTYDLDLNILFSLVPELEILEINNFQFDAESIQSLPKKLKTLIFNQGALTEELLFTLLASIKTITKISLIETSITASLVEIDWPGIELNLQTAEIISSKIPSEALASIILNNIRLQFLTIRDVDSLKLIPPNYFIEAPPLHALITLELVANEIDELIPILPEKNSPLQYLYLDDIFSFKETYKFPSLPDLEVCKLVGNISYLSGFLRDSHNLSSLTLNPFDLSEDITPLPPLPQLSILKFEGAAIPANIAASLFQQAPNIRYFSILREISDKNGLNFEQVYMHDSIVDNLDYFMPPNSSNALPFEKILTILLRPTRSLGLHDITIDLDDMTNTAHLLRENEKIHFLLIKRVAITDKQLAIILSLLPRLKRLHIKIATSENPEKSAKLIKESDLQEIGKKFPYLTIHSETQDLDSNTSLISGNQVPLASNAETSEAIQHSRGRNRNDFLSNTDWQKTTNTLQLPFETSSAHTEYVISEKKLITFLGDVEPTLFRADCFVFNRITGELESINPNNNMQSKNNLQKISHDNEERINIYTSTHSPDKNNKIISVEYYFEKMRQSHIYVLPQQGIKDNLLNIVSSVAIDLEVYYLPFFNFRYVIAKKDITTPFTLTYSMEHIPNEFIMPEEFDKFHLDDFKMSAAFFMFMKNSAPHIDISDLVIKDRKNHFLYEKINIAPFKPNGMPFFQFDERGRLRINPRFSQDFLSLSKREQIAQLTLFFRSFTDESLTGEYPDFLSFYNAMLQQKRGICSHRSYLFLYLADELGIYSQIADNPIHNYIEVTLGSTLRTLDLDGGNRSTFKRVFKEETDIGSSKEIVEKFNPLEEHFANALFVFNDAKELATLNQVMFEKFKKSYYYLHSMDDIFHEQLIAEETGAYKFSESPLVTFLQQEGGILAINLSDASKEQLLECLNLLNREKINQQQFVGVDCEKTLRVIFIVAKNNPHLVPHDKMRIIYANQIIANSAVANVTAMQLDNMHSLNLYENSASWEALLIGLYTMEGTKAENTTTESKKAPNTKVLVTPGALINALEKKASGIRLLNLPQDEKLHRFLNEIRHKKSFIFNGVEYSIPDNFIIETGKEFYKLGNAFSLSQQPITSLPMPNVFCLNSTTFPNFFHTYHCENQQLFIQSGWLKMAKESVLIVAITEILPISLFAQFLHEAALHNVKIHFTISPELPLPTELAAAMQSKVTIDAIQPPQTIAVKIIHSNDIDFSIELIEKHHPNNIETLYVSNESYADLIAAFEATGIKEQKPYFSITAGCVAQWLHTGKTVFLYGKFSSDFIKQISTLLISQPYLWINGEKFSVTGKLFLISEQSVPLPDCPTHAQKFTTEDFFDYLKQAYPTRIELIANLHRAINKLAGKEVLFSFVQIKTMMKMLQLKPLVNPLRVFLHTHPQRENLLAMTDDYFAPEVQYKRIKLSSSNVEEVEDIIATRIAEIKDVFTYSPFSILDGSTGTGKSAIIPHFTKEYDVFSGEENIELFFARPEESATASINQETASRSTDILPITKRKKRLLFIDEMNISDPNTWNFLKNLCSDTPRVLYRTKIYALTTEDDRIILAGNFNKKYGGGRHEQTLVSQYGAIIEFKPFPASFLAKKIISPRLNSMQLSQLEQEKAEDIFLQAYKLANNKLEQLDSYIAVSPRNLEMMLHRWAWLCQQMPTMATLEVAKIAAYREIKTLFDDKAVRRELKQAALIDPQALQQWTTFKKETVSSISGSTFMLTPTHILPNAKHFIITHSRTSPLYKLHELMSLRKKIMQDPHNKSHLHGLLYEGEPSSGKLFLLRAYLEFNNIPHETIKPHKAKQQLIELFHKGHVAIIPRIGMLGIERTLNLLMMGIDPQGKSAENPGFVVLATQLNQNQSGTLSPAVFNRFEQDKAKSYSNQELVDILVRNIGFDTATATTRVSKFRNDVQKNTDNVVTLDNLFKKAP